LLANFATFYKLADSFKLAFIPPGILSIILEGKRLPLTGLLQKQQKAITQCFFRIHRNASDCLPEIVRKFISSGAGNAHQLDGFRLISPMAIHITASKCSLIYSEHFSYEQVFLRYEGNFYPSKNISFCGGRI